MAAKAVNPIIPQVPVVPTVSKNTRALVSKEFSPPGGLSEVIDLSDRARSVQVLGADAGNIEGNTAKAIFLCLATAATITVSVSVFFLYLAPVGLTAQLISAPVLAAVNYAMIAHTIMETLSAITRSSPDKLKQEWMRIHLRKAEVAVSSNSEMQSNFSAISRKKASLTPLLSGSEYLDRDVAYRLKNLEHAHQEIQIVWNWVRA